MTKHVIDYTNYDPEKDYSISNKKVKLSNSRLLAIEKGGEVSQARRSSKIQSEMASRAGEKNVQTGWIKKFQKVGSDAVHYTVICPNCGTSGDKMVMRRWHFEKCQFEEFYKDVPWSSFKFGQVVDLLGDKYSNIRGFLNRDPRFKLVKKGLWIKETEEA